MSIEDEVPTDLTVRLPTSTVGSVLGEVLELKDGNVYWDERLFPETFPLEPGMRIGGTLLWHDDLDIYYLDNQPVLALVQEGGPVRVQESWTHDCGNSFGPPEEIDGLSIEQIKTVIAGTDREAIRSQDPVVSDARDRLLELHQDVSKRSLLSGFCTAIVPEDAPAELDSECTRTPTSDCDGEWRDEEEDEEGD